MIKYIVARKDLKSPKLDIGVDTSKETVLEIYKGKGMCAKYNRGIDSLKRDTKRSDIICLLHDDTKILDPLFREKVEFLFEQLPYTVITGVIGANVLEANKGWWQCHDNYHVGNIMQGDGNNNYKKMGKKLAFSNDAIVVDGCIMFIRASFLFDYLFDEKTFTDYHCYDYDICLKALSLNYDVAISEILIQHNSMGNLDNTWGPNIEKLYDKWKNILKFPIIK